MRYPIYYLHTSLRPGHSNNLEPYDQHQQQVNNVEMRPFTFLTRFLLTFNKLLTTFDLKDHKLFREVKN